MEGGGDGGEGGHGGDGDSEGMVGSISGGVAGTSSGGMAHIGFCGMAPGSATAMHVGKATGQCQSIGVCDDNPDPEELRKDMRKVADLRGEPGITECDDGFDIRIESHGPVEVQKRIRSYADKLDLAMISLYASYLQADVRNEKSIIAVPGTFGAPPMVSGVEQQSGGQTNIWRQYWHIGYRRTPVGLAEYLGVTTIPLVPRLGVRGFIEVTVVTWLHASGQRETHVRVVVKTIPVRDRDTRKYFHDREDGLRHYSKAATLATKIAKLLRSHATA